MQIKLNKCPTCGAKAAKLIEQKWFGKMTSRIECAKCGTRTAKRTSAQAAINAWNKHNSV